MPRKYRFLLTLIAGAALTVVGFLLSAPIGPTDGPTISDPRLPFAPLIFVIGVVLIFGSAIAYEVGGDR